MACSLRCRPDEGVDLGDEIFGADEGTTADLLLSEQRKPTLDLIDPGRVSRRELDVETPPCREPFAHLRVFVCGVIVHDDMDVEFLGHAGVDMLEEAKNS